MERLNKVTLSSDISGESDASSSSDPPKPSINSAVSGIHDVEENGTDDEDWEDAQETIVENDDAETSLLIDPKPQLAELQVHAKHVYAGPYDQSFLNIYITGTARRGQQTEGRRERNFSRVQLAKSYTALRRRHSDIASSSSCADAERQRESSK